MKKIIRTFFIFLVSLRAVSLVIPVLSFDSGFKTSVLAALILTVFEYTLKPITRFLLLPINILTLGTLRWVIDAIGLFLITLLVKDFGILPYTFPGANIGGIILPKIKFSLLFTYLITSLIIDIIINIIKWIFKK